MRGALFPHAPGRGDENAGNWPSGTLLAGLTDSARKRLFGIGAQVQFADSGRMLIREGDTTSTVFLLLAGMVKVSSRTETGEALLAVRVGGDMVGELAALDGRPRLATVTTAGPVIARVIGKAEFNAFLVRNPDVSLAITRGITDKLRSATARRIDFTGCLVATRFARVLLELAERYGRQTDHGLVIVCQLTQTELAALVGAAEPTIQRVLRQLRTDRVVANRYRQITVLDVATLRARAFPEPALTVRPRESALKPSHDGIQLPT